MFLQTPLRLRICTLLAGIALWPAHGPMPGSASTSDASLQRKLREIQALYDDGRYHEACAQSQELLREAGSSYRSHSLETAEVIDLAALALDKCGRIHELHGEDLARRALAIKEELLPPTDPRVASSQLILGRTLIYTGNTTEALQLFEKALKVRSAAYGPESPEAAEALTWSGQARAMLHGYSRGSADLEKALAIQEKSRSGDPGLTLIYLSLLDRETGDYTAEKEHAIRSLQARENTRRPDHPDIASSLTVLALALDDMGDLAAAVEADRMALAIRQKSLGAEHGQVGSSLLNLGFKLMELGDYASAYTLTEESGRIGLAVNGPDHPSAGHAANNLGDILLRMGRYPDASRMLENAIRIKERVNGPEHEKLISSLTTLARVRMATGDYDEAARLLQRAQAIATKVYGPDHPVLASILNQLASVAVGQGKLEQAHRLAEQALRTQENGLGRTHPGAAETLVIRAGIALRQNRPDEALRLSLEANALLREHLHSAAQALSEREALRYEEVRSSGLDLAMGVILENRRNTDPEATCRVWDEQIRSRALVLDESASRHQGSLESGDPDTVALVENLEKARNRLARLVRVTPGSQQVRTLGEKVRAAREEEERAERVLAARSSRFRKQEHTESVGLQQVQEALPPAGALVAYVQFLAAQPTPHKAYAAFLLTSGGKPRARILGPVEPIDGMVRKWRESAGTEPSRAESEEETRELGLQLRRAIWDPVAGNLATAGTIFVVPEGSLNLVNLAALPADNGSYLVEKGPLLHYLSAERDLVQDQETPATGKGLLALGGPDFSAEGNSGGVIRPSVFTSLLRGPSSQCADFRSMKFSPLPGTLAEVDEVESLWKAGNSGGGVVKLTGLHASEEAFKKKAPGKRVLHLATHGFFLDDRCESSLRNAQRTARGGAPLGEESLRGETPLVLSGLAMAGANQRDDARASQREPEDGILTAAEVASLDLRGVEWAVLSACATGVGPVQSGEGVLGLRRAFQVAGARTTIMSLWEISDLPARQWIQRLYREKLSGLTTAQSVRRASLDILEARRKAGVTTHPFYWGAFIASGDWR